MGYYYILRLNTSIGRILSSNNHANGKLYLARSRYDVFTHRKYKMNKTYRLLNTKIGNSNEFRPPAEFYQEHPQFAGSDGWIEVISDNTAVIHIEPSEVNEEEADDDSLMMRLFLDFAIAQTLKNQELKPYNVEMSTIARGLIADVELNDE